MKSLSQIAGALWTAFLSAGAENYSSLTRDSHGGRPHRLGRVFTWSFRRSFSATASDSGTNVAFYTG